MTTNPSKLSNKAGDAQAARRHLAILLLCAAAAGSASAGLKLVSDIKPEDSNVVEALDPYALGSANNPGKISAQPGDGDEHKRFGTSDSPMWIDHEAIGQGPFQPTNPDLMIGGTGQLTMGADVARSGGNTAIGFAWVPPTPGPSPVPAPGSLVILGAAAGLAGRRRR